MLSNNTSSSVDCDSTTFMGKVYGLMGLSLFLAFVTAYCFAKADVLGSLAHSGVSTWIIVGSYIVALILDYALSVGVASLAIKQPRMALAGMIVYSFVDGAILSVMFLLAPTDVLLEVFGATVLTFACTSLLGLKIQHKLKWGVQLGGAMIALIVVSVIGIFWFNTVVDIVISGIAVLVFALFNIYMTQQLKDLGKQYNGYSGAVILGAVTLYNAFVGIFINLLEIFLDFNNRN